MPITFRAASHSANPVVEWCKCSSVNDILTRNLGGGKQAKEVLQSSFSSQTVDHFSLVAQPNGFVNTVVDAYNRHHHLVLRPDDVWMAILSQFNF